MTIPDHSENFLYSLSRTLLLGSLLGAPLAYGAVQEWAWGTLAVVAWALLLLWCLAGVQEGVLRIVWSPLYWPAGLFLLLGMVQYFRHRTADASATGEALLKFSTDLIFFFLAGQLLGTLPAPCRPRLLSPQVLIPVYTFGLALFAILQFLSNPAQIYGTPQLQGWPFGPYINHNHYAGLMEMLIPLAAASVLSAFWKYPAALLFGMATLVPVASLLLAGSRGALVGLAVETVLAALLIGRWGGLRVGKSWLGPAGLMLLIALILFFWMAPASTVRRLATMTDDTHSPEAAVGERLQAARDSLRIFRSHPGLGAGLGAFETVFPQSQSFASDLSWDHAHNDYAEMLAESGVAGGTLVAISLAMFLGLAFRNLRRRLAHPLGWVPFAASLSCCALLVHSLVDFNLHIPANAAWFAVSAALATTGGEQAVSRSAVGSC